MRKNICCNIYFNAALMGERNALFDLFVRKILRLCPQTKRLAAQIDRIGSNESVDPRIGEACLVPLAEKDQRVRLGRRRRSGGRSPGRRGL